MSRTLADYGAVACSVGMIVVSGILIAKPETRNIVILQLRRGTPIKILLPARTVSQVLEAHPGDPALELAAIFPTGSLEQFEHLMRRYPREAVILAMGCLRATTVLRYSQRQYGPNDRLYGYRPDRVEPPDLHNADRAILIAREGIRIQPDNGFFNIMLAGFLFARGNDKEAIVAVHDGVRKNEWNDHTLEMADASIRLKSLQQYSLDPIERANLAFGIPYARLARYRQLARTMIGFSETERIRNPRLSCALRLDVTRLGGLIRRKAPDVLNGLTGNAITSLSADFPLSKEKLQRATEGMSTQSRSETIKQLRLDAVSKFITEHSGAESLLWFRSEIEQSANFKKIAQQFFATQPDLGIPWKIALSWLVSTTLIASAFWFVFVSAVCAIVRSLNRTKPDMNVRWNLTDWALFALLCCAVCLCGMIVWGVEWYQAFTRSSFDDIAGFTESWVFGVYHNASPLSLALPLGVVIGIAVCNFRLSGKDHFSRAYFKTLAASCLRMIPAFLFVITCTYTLLLISLRQNAMPLNRAVERMFQGEVKEMINWAQRQKVGITLTPSTSPSPLQPRS